MSRIPQLRNFKLLLTYATGGGRRRIERTVFGVKVGQFAVHQCLDKYPPGLLWQITHIQSGYVVSKAAYYRELNTAYEVAKHLHDKVWKVIWSSKSRGIPKAKAEFEKVVDRVATKIKL